MKIGNKRVIEEKRQNNIHAYAMQYLKVILVACQVWSKVKFFHTLFDGYLKHVRQALNTLPKIKHVVYYNAMQGTTHAHFLVKLLKSSTLSSFLNLQNVASFSDLVKISTNWSSVLTPSSDISFFATWSLRKVMADIYVLGVRVLNQVINKFYRTPIVTQKGYLF